MSKKNIQKLLQQMAGKKKKKVKKKKPIDSQSHSDKKFEPIN